MEFLDRYLEAVRKHLPWQRQDDLLAELRANLEAQLEEKEAALGRPLTAAEAEAWLKQLGSPMQMAAPYQPQQSLIGPALFPLYRSVLKLACGWGAIIYAIATVARILAANHPSGSALLWGLLWLPNLLLTIAAWVTLGFASVEFAVTHGYIPAPKQGPFAAGWSLASLPPAGAPSSGGKKQKTFAQAVAEAVFGVFFLGYFVLVPRHPWLLLGPGAALLAASPYQLAPVWTQFYWFVVALNVLQTAWNLLNLASGRWRRPQTIRDIVYRTLGLIPCGLLLAAPNQMTILLKQPALDQAHYGAQLNTINHWVHAGFLVIVVIAVAQLVWEIGRMSIDARRRQLAAMQ